MGISNDSEQDFSSPDLDNLSVADALTPSTHSGATSPSIELEEDPILTSQKKKKKKKPKKSAKAKEAVAAARAKEQESDGRPVLCISRNKHWRYISSYHGPWLQLPLELLDSLLVLNLDPTGYTAAPDPVRLPVNHSPANISASKQKDPNYSNLSDHTPPDSPRRQFTSLSSSLSLASRLGKSTPPPIDPGVFKSVTTIRRLIDDAAELSVRAASGLSAAELASSRSSSNLNSPWATASTLGMNPLGGGSGRGRNVAMSAMRIHRLRALAVQKLAQAYQADEIASSVMVMQGGSVFDDVAERVLKHDPTDLDARYVHFFHEKIPSRQLAESTSTKVLDDLISARPQHLEYYRTRGIVSCFRDEYPQATKDFTYALKEARAVRKAKTTHHKNHHGDSRLTKNGKRKKSIVTSHTNGQAPPNGTSVLGAENVGDGADGEPVSLLSSILREAPEPIELQLLFLRGAAYLQHAIFLIEAAVLQLEGVQKVQAVDGAELRLCYIDQGKYGGVEIGNPDGPLGRNNGVKVAAYREVLAFEELREQITTLLKRSVRDHEKFLSHFDSIESPNALHRGDIAHQMEYAFLLAESTRSNAHSTTPNGNTPVLPSSEVPAIFTTYHPLIVESHFSVLICQLMLADFIGLLPTFARTAALVDGLEGCPIFLPARSMGQAEFMQILERLAGGWAHGTKPHSLALAGLRGKAKLAIEAPPSLRSIPSSHASPSSLHEAAFSSSAIAPSMSTIRGANERIINGESSSSSSSGSTAPLVPPDDSNSTFTPWGPPPSPVDGAKSLDCARILLAPVAKRQRLRADRAAVEKANRVNGVAKKKPSTTLTIPLHGPRVEIVLAWLGAVHLPELDGFV